MQRYHFEVEGIPEYMNMLEDAKKYLGRSGRTIADETLLLFVSTEMLTTERYPQSNNNLEDRAKDGKNLSNWKTGYKKAHAKARVKPQAAKGDDKFGAANAAEQVLGVGFNNNSGVTTENGGYEVGLKALEG